MFYKRDDGQAPPTGQGRAPSSIRKPEQLTGAQMEQARRAFRGKLVRMRRFSPEFIVNNCDEMLATACMEYARALDKGVEIEEPVAWLVHCAWRRTQNLLTQQSYRPKLVSTEKVPEVAADGALTPEDHVLLEDRARQVRELVAKLDDDQRRLVWLMYLEGMSIREAKSHLQWSHGKTQRCYEAVLREIRRRLPVRSSDELEIDIGVAAWISLAGAAGATHLPAGFEAVLEKAEQGATGLWARAHDLARRFTIGGGGDAAGAVASSGAGRAAGVCATGLALACVAGGATGVIGPGIGAIDSSSGHQQTVQRHASHRPAPQSSRDPVVPLANDSVATTPPAAVDTPGPTQASTPSSSSETNTPSRSAKKAAAEREREAEEATPEAEAERVEEQASGIARAGSESASGTAASGASTSTGSNATEVVDVKPPSESSSTSAATAANNKRVSEQTSGLARAGG